MIDRSGIHPPRRLLLPLDPSARPDLIRPRRILLPTRLLDRLRLLLLHLTAPDEIPPASIIRRREITPDGLVHMERLACPLGPVKAATGRVVCPRAGVVREELVYGVGGGEGERGQAEGLTEEESEAGRAVDVEFCLPVRTSVIGDRKSIIQKRVAEGVGIFRFALEDVYGRALQTQGIRIPSPCSRSPVT